MRTLLETPPIQLMGGAEKGKQLRGCVSLGNGFVHQYIVLTELGMQVVRMGGTAKEEERVGVAEAASTATALNGATRTKARLTMQSEKRPIKAWEHHAVGSVHRRFRLPPSVSIAATSKHHKPVQLLPTTAKVLHSTFTKRSGKGHEEQNEQRLQALNTRVCHLEEDLKEVRESFQTFTKEMQSDLHRALGIVGRLLAERPPRF